MPRSSKSCSNAGDESEDSWRMGADVIADTPEQFAKFLRDETAKWTKVVKDAGIKPE